MVALTGSLALPQNQSTACFSVVANTDPSVLPRVLQVFAKLGRVPGQCHSTVSGHRGEELHIDMQFPGMSTSETEKLANLLRCIVEVTTVLTSEKTARRAA